MIGGTNPVSCLLPTSSDGWATTTSDDHQPQSLSNGLLPALPPSPYSMPPPPFSSPTLVSDSWLPTQTWGDRSPLSGGGRDEKGRPGRGSHAMREVHWTTGRWHTASDTRSDVAHLTPGPPGTKPLCPLGPHWALPRSAHGWSGQCLWVLVAHGGVQSTCRGAAG